MQGNGDINSMEDRIWCCANIVALEEHAFSSWLRTGDNTWLGKMVEFRRQRTAVMRGLLGNGAAESKAEVWCMFKHCLAGAMRAMESGNRYEGAAAERFYTISKQMVDNALEIIAICQSEGAEKESEDGAENGDDISPLFAENANSVDGNADKKEEVSESEDEVSESVINEILKDMLDELPLELPSDIPELKTVKDTVQTNTADNAKAASENISKSEKEDVAKKPITKTQKAFQKFKEILRCCWE